MGEPDVCRVVLSVNGANHAVDAPADETLLDTLRDRLRLTGTKRGCDRGACGSCTVLADGRAILSCLVLTPMAAGARIVTIEGAPSDARVRALQDAFIAHDALQCGFCTPGQILAAAGLLARGAAAGDVRDAMSGNLCRCGAYPNIVAAIEAVAARGAR